MSLLALLILGCVMLNRRRKAMNPSFIAGLCITGVIVLCAVFAPTLAPYDPIQIDIANKFQSPNSKHWFGTDQYGRDVLSRILVGARYDLLIAVSAVLVAAVIGTPLGILAGYFRGPIE